MPKLKFDHCVIHVSDWERSNAFYRDVMGAEVIRRGQGWVYRFGDMQLNCHGPGLDPTSGGAAAGSTRQQRLVLRMAGADRCGARRISQAHGVAIELGPVERHAARGKGTSVYFRDPDGSLLEFISYA